MATYLELKEQAEKLLAEAERMREQEIADAIADIKRKIDLLRPDRRRPGFCRGWPWEFAAQIGQITGEIPRPQWGNLVRGTGRKPQWVAQALKEGRNLEEFAVKNGR